jgi:hypothetical protein
MATIVTQNRMLVQPPVQPAVKPISLLPLRIFLPQNNAEMIRQRSFRGRRDYHKDGFYTDDAGNHYDWLPDNLAGNFSEWDSYQDMVVSGFINDELRPRVAAAIRENPKAGPLQVEIDTGKDIGWASSIQADELPQSVRDTLEVHRLKRGQAYMVSDPCLLVPRTHLVSFNCFKKPSNEGPGWVCLIYHLYAGPNLGDLQNRDVTAETGLVLFSKSQRGV